MAIRRQSLGMRNALSQLTAREALSMLFKRHRASIATGLLRNALGFGTALLLLATPLAAPASAAEIKVVADGLDNPRGLDFGLHGALYVAEAGKGGDGPCLPSPEGGNACYGASGAITKILNNRQERVATGLPSLAGDGANAIGPRGVSAVTPGDLQAAIGWGYTLDQRTQFAQTAKDPRINDFGRLVRVQPNGSVRSIADLMAYEHANDPDKEGENSDRISTVAVFPARNVPGAGGATIPMDAVPTSVVRGPDGALYVGELTGFPFPPGGARVYRVVPGCAPEVCSRSLAMGWPVMHPRPARS